MDFSLADAGTSGEVIEKATEKKGGEEK